MNFEELAVFKLQYGNHDSAEEGLCAMEAVAWLEGLPHDDHPKCTCPIIANFVREINDMADDEQRQRLVAYLPRLVGTISPEYESERIRHWSWSVATIFAPFVLDLFKLPGHAKALRDLRPGDWGTAKVIAFAAASAAHDAGTECPPEAYAVYTCISAAYAINAIYVGESRAAIGDASQAVECASKVAFLAACEAAGNITDDFQRGVYVADDSAPTRCTDMAFEILDGLLAIGPASSGFSTDTAERIAAYRELVT